MEANYVPTDFQLTELQAGLQLSVKNLQQADENLSSISEKLNHMLKEREILKRSIEEHYSLLTPFRCLPDDILSEIFVWCLPEDHQALTCISSPPLILGCVCRRWRSVAYRTPELWASLHIAIPKLPSGRHIHQRIPGYSYSAQHLGPSLYEETLLHADVKRHRDAIQDWLMRSGSRPLSISLSKSGLTYAIGYMELILSFSTRLHHLQLDLRGRPKALKSLCSLSQTAFPNLCTLDIKFDSRESDRLQWKTSRLLNSPKLQGLKIESTPLPFTDISIGWAHLTRLDISSSHRRPMDTHDVHKIFSSCPQLTHCFFSLVRDSGQRQNMPSITRIPIALLHLRALFITDSSNELGEIFETLDVPALRELSYVARYWPESSRRSSLLSILPQTKMGLSHLTTNVQFMSRADLIDCLALCPNLTHFSSIRGAVRHNILATSNDSEVLSFVLDLMLPSANHPPALPALQILHIKEYPGLNLSDDTLLQFITKRMDAGPSVAPLREVTLLSNREAQTDITVQLARYIKDGLKINLTYRKNHDFTFGAPPNIFPRNGIDRDEDGLFGI